MAAAGNPGLLQRQKFSGSEEELEGAYTYMKAVTELEEKLRKNKVLEVAEEEEPAGGEDEQETQPTPTAKARGRGRGR